MNEHTTRLQHSRNNFITAAKRASIMAWAQLYNEGIIAKSHFHLVPRHAADKLGIKTNEVIGDSLRFMKYEANDPAIWERHVPDQFMLFNTLAICDNNEKFVV